MKRAVRLHALSLLFCSLVCCLVVFCSLLRAQETSAWGRTLVVIPFENASSAPGLDWLGEGFAEGLRWRLDSPVLYVATREERLRAYDRQGIPAGLHPSRATLYRLAEQMDVDYAVLGSSRADGSNLTVTAQLLDMRGQKLLPVVTESGRLEDVVTVQSAVAWDLLRMIRPNFALPKDRFIAGVAPMQTAALEAYVHGEQAATDAERLKDYREAVRLNPAFAEAWLELGKSYYAQKSYEAAIGSFEKIPATSPVAREANFYLGLSSCAQGDLEKAARAFEFVAARVPLAEVYNNLGVVAARRGQRSVEDFERAVQDDPSDPDYHFNLAVAFSQAGEKARAVHEARIALEHHSNDAEAKMLLESLAPSAGGVVNSSATLKLPPERLKRDYAENVFRQMTTQMESWAEQQFARADPRTHARYHVELGRELMEHGFTSEAEAEFKHAATVDPGSPAPLAALAELYDARGETQQARAEAEASLRVHESVDAYLVLTRLDLREDHTDRAAQNINRILQLEPRNAIAQDLQRTLAAKLAEKGQR